MDEQQIREIFEELRKQMEASAAEQRILGQTSQGTASAIKVLQAELSKAGKSAVAVAKQLDEAADAERKATEATKTYKEGLKSGAKGVAQGTASLIGSMASGNTSFAQFGQMAQNVTNLLGKLANGIPVLGKYVDGAIQAAGAAGAAVIGQLDTVAKAYTDLGKVGAIGAQGVDDLVTQFKELGLVSLPAFTDAVSRNALGLGALASTTSQGSKILGKSLGQLTDRNGQQIQQLIAMGYSIDEAAAITTQFASTQALAGNRQIRTVEGLTKASMEYLKEIDLLARATGRSREQIVEERQKNLQNIAFRSKLDAMRASGEIEAAKQLEKATDIGGPLADAIRASVTGSPLTKEAQLAVSFLGGSVMDLVNNIKQGSTAQAEMYRLVERSSSSLEGFNDTLAFGVSEQLGLDALAFQVKNFRDRIAEGKDPFAEAAAEQGELAKAGGKTTKEFANATIAVAGASRNVQALAFDAIPMATAAVKGFANAVTASTNALRKVLGLGSVSGPAGPNRGQSRGFSSGAAKPPTGGSGDYLSRIAQLESGGRNIGNIARAGQSATSAFGLYQITSKTFESLVANAPSGSPLKGKTFEDMKGDVGLQTEAMKALTSSNEGLLARRGLSTSDAAKYMAHMLGYPTAARVLEAPGSMPLDRLIPKDWLEKNNLSQYQTAEGLRKHFSKITGGGGYQFGGIASGPKSGYSTVLHGNEAVVPLPNGNTIPVEMSGMQINMDRQLGILGQQLGKMDEMISALRAQTSVSQRILQVSQA